MPLIYEGNLNHINLYFYDDELTFEIVTLFSRFKKIRISINQKAWSPVSNQYLNVFQLDDKDFLILESNNLTYDSFNIEELTI